MKKANNKIVFNLLILCFSLLFTVSLINFDTKTIETTAKATTDKKIEWGIKRGKDHSQPDLGSTNKSIIDNNNGISMGNSQNPYIYLTFDCGYEAGYTEKILEVLKQNDVKATFFITGHYLNSVPELVKKMIDDGHIIGNHTPISLMSGDNIKVKC